MTWSSNLCRAGFWSIVVGLHVAPALAAQSTLSVFTPPPILFPFEQFGAALAAIGDVDNDGVQDYAVGSPQDSMWDPGRVSIISGASGASLREIAGYDVGSSFGQALEAVGDVDSDGYVDVLAYGPAQISANSELRLFSARTGATLSSAFVGNHPWCCRDHELGGGEDVDGDTVPDYAATGFWNNVDWSVQVWSGATHALLRDIGVGAQDDARGAFAMLGDLDGDQRSEIAYAADAGGGNGAVHIVSGATSAVLRTFRPSPAALSYCLSELERVDDFDGDGVQDFAVGDVCSGRVSIVSSATALLIRAHDDPVGGTYFGSELAGRGDLDGDGVPDLLVGAPLANGAGAHRGSVLAYSGRTGVELFRTHHIVDDGMAGTSLENAGDVDGDGFADFAFGQPRASFGRVFLESPIPLPPRAVGTPKINSLGCTPQLAWTGDASATSATPFTIQATQILNQKIGTFFYGLGDPVALPFQGGTLSAPAPRRRTPYQSSGGSVAGSDCTGVFAIDFNARIQSGLDPALTVAARVVGQYWSRDPAGSSTTNLTSAVELVIGP